MNFRRLSTVQKTHRWSFVMDVSHIGLTLCNCGRVSYVLSRKIRISPRFDNYIHDILPSKIVPWHFRFTAITAHSRVFFGKLDFLYNQEFSAHGKNVYYTIKCGVETTAFRIVYVQSAKLCGPRSNRLNSICKVYFWPLLHKLCNDCVASTYFREQNCIHTSLQSWARRWGISGLWKLRMQYRRHSHAFRFRVQKTRKFKLYFAVSNHFL
jgi:hypothetical protein